MVDPRDVRVPLVLHSRMKRSAMSQKRRTSASGLTQVSAQRQDAVILTYAREADHHLAQAWVAHQLEVTGLLRPQQCLCTHSGFHS